MPRRNECPACHEPPEVVGLFWHLHVHWCTPSNTMLYTNGLLWSTSYKEITGVERTRKSKRTTRQDRQVSGEIVSLERQHQRKDSPSPA